MMDDVTQQNAALVEEASAAAQALTEQASNLTQLIARYKLPGVRPTAAATPAATPAEAGPVERRSPNRPLSGKRPASAAPSRPASAASRAAPAASRAAPARKVETAADEEWKDF